MFWKSQEENLCTRLRTIPPKYMRCRKALRNSPTKKNVERSVLKMPQTVTVRLNVFLCSETFFSEVGFLWPQRSLPWMYHWYVPLPSCKDITVCWKVLIYSSKMHAPENECPVSCCDEYWMFHWLEKWVVSPIKGNTLHVSSWNSMYTVSSTPMPMLF